MYTNDKEEREHKRQPDVYWNEKILHGEGDQKHTKVK